MKDRVQILSISHLGVGRSIRCLRVMALLITLVCRATNTGTILRIFFFKKIVIHVNENLPICPVFSFVKYDVSAEVSAV